jgi:predicted Zn-dependent protease
MKKELKEQIQPEFDRASLLWKQNRTAEALQIFQGLNEKFPNQPTIVLMLGTVSFTRGDMDSAQRYFQELVKLKPNYEKGSLALFFSLKEQERFAEAIAEAKRFISQNGLTKEYALLMEELDEEGAFNTKSKTKPVKES